MAMSADSIIEHLYVVKDVDTHLIACFVDLLFDAFLFETAEEGSTRCMVPILASSTHARFEVMWDTEAKSGVAAVLPSLIRMYDD
jgi:hypothetical protein